MRIRGRFTRRSLKPNPAIDRARAAQSLFRQRHLYGGNMRSAIAFGRGFAALSFVLIVAACGAGGGGGGSSTPTSKLFVADGGNLAIGSQINSNPGAGSFAIDRIIQGSSTGLGTGAGNILSIPGLVVDAAPDRMFVATQTRLLVFDQAGLATGNVAPSRNVTATVVKGGTTFGVNFFRLSLDTTGNVLYTTDSQGEVHLLNHAGPLNGAVTPNRTIGPSTGAGAGISGIAIDRTRDLLYVGGVSVLKINSFTNALTDDTTPNGPARTPDRVLTFNGGVNSFSLDTINDRLYASINTDIQVFDNASALSSLGTVTPSRTMNFGTSGWFLFIEPTGNRLYAVRNNVVMIVNAASTAIAAVVGTVMTIPSAGQFGAVAVEPHPLTRFRQTHPDSTHS